MTGIFIEIPGMAHRLLPLRGPAASVSLDLRRARVPQRCDATNAVLQPCGSGARGRDLLSRRTGDGHLRPAGSLGAPPLTEGCPHAAQLERADSHGPDHKENTQSRDEERRRGRHHLERLACRGIEGGEKGAREYDA